MNARALRRVQRVIHLVAATVLGAYVYSPLGTDEAFTAAVRLATFPLLVVTGLGMWAVPRLMARGRRRRVAFGRS